MTVHTNQLDNPKQVLTYEAGVVPSLSTHVADVEYTLAKANLSILEHDDLSGQLPGSSFLTDEDYATGTLVVVEDGLRVDPDEISETGSDSFDTSPALSGSRLDVYYLPSGSVEAGTPNLDRVTFIGGSKKTYIAELENATVLLDTTGGALTITLPLDLSTNGVAMRTRWKNIGSNTATLVPPVGVSINGVLENYVIAAGPENEEFVFASNNLFRIRPLVTEVVSEAPTPVETDGLGDPPDISVEASEGPYTGYIPFSEQSDSLGDPPDVSVEDSGLQEGYVPTPVTTNAIGLKTFIEEA